MVGIITATIGRFGQEVRTYAIEEGKTIRDLLAKANIVKTDSEDVVDSNSIHIDLNAEVLNDEKYYLITKYKSGN